ncbi:hypothetical protein GCM10011506_36820 [Marivirga lumbricoides]|uniref:Acetyltransferase n=1 Tax=Marivirga lumbricoides TaxID=1046115 RepID=A0ABQ1MZ98_9BACT|nr:hypothetical protein GCM10011506_36820 [Marivirga lumbricoides]
MKTLVQNIVQLRNPAFRLHESVSSQDLIQFTYTQVRSLLRGMKMIFKGKKNKMALLGRGVRIVNSHKFTYGRFMKLGDFVYISALGKKGIKMGSNVSLGSFSRVVVATTLDNPGEGICIGDNVGIGEFAYLGGAGGLEIGNDCIVGQYFSCHPENHNYEDHEKLIRMQGVSRKGIKIGANCWIGSKVTILDGVEVGEGSVIAAGAVVTKSFPAYSIIGGVPAKLIKTRK